VLFVLTRAAGVLIQHRNNVMKEKQLPVEKPEIYAIKKAENGAIFSRKDFLKKAGVIGAGLVATTSCASLFDTSIRKERTREIIQMEQVSKTFTLPCGSPIPPEATCICDCVESSRTYPGTEWVCSCNTITISRATPMADNWTCSCNTVMTCTCDKVCTCDSVCSCNNHSRSYTTYSSYWYPN